MIDNIETIKPLLSWESEDEFYFCQVLKRKKENPELGSNSHVCKTYYITSHEQLDKDYGEMKCLADYHTARVCINLNKRSFERTCYHTLKKITDQIMNKDFKQVRKAYNSVCGTYASGDKMWVVDIDRDDSSYFHEKLANVLYCIRNIEPNEGEEKVIARIPTKNGLHLLTKPFNLQKFRTDCPEIDVHKNNPTILYIP